ncbi:uncharacterized protein L969DRAFT_48912 [Mixia osmundae IAM 14324]|uniref:CBM1 domain-containing protein n=1 Tax=Mixia osmundae (strain CBS 9802 / IAM 14324 / JCM 22182 / KY 12970) TaxID=764103 RepID=G7E473_MIXOS|nr:uncharacterized protein L969DRAFT_48912 [Mixia osmundae IAM 14324]KEI39729.1 hypothetical protein L969DRAFT_48912 [Mixia osmundae IAM 14324]GAA97633.1 hypothetical protein E5Q_04311 [Mixia osmundae IAM 14324]
MRLTASMLVAFVCIVVARPQDISDIDCDTYANEQLCLAHNGCGWNPADVHSTVPYFVTTIDTASSHSDLCAPATVVRSPDQHLAPRSQKFNAIHDFGIAQTPRAQDRMKFKPFMVVYAFLVMSAAAQTYPCSAYTNGASCLYAGCKFYPANGACVPKP